MFFWMNLANSRLAGRLGFLLALILLAGSSTRAQYRFPLDGQNALSGTFGELRSNHFHSGIDIKTYGKTGLPVYAIADGWVYRLRTGPYGFGLAVYLRHPDGRFSVYAHLDRFHDALAAYVRAAQQRRETYDQDIYLTPGEIPVRQGDVIAYSGNSGSSYGPHLHFEIRDSLERILNPLAWYQADLPDTRRPILQEVAITPLSVAGRVRGEFRPLYLTPSGGEGDYELPHLIRVRGPVGLEYKAYDLLNGAGNHCGINYARLYLDDRLVHELALDRFAFDETRNINLHMDYARYEAQRERFQRAYVEPGNEFSGYRPLAGAGQILLRDDVVHHLRLELEDAHGNQSVLRARLQRDVAGDEVLAQAGYYQHPEVAVSVFRGVAVITARYPHASYQQGLQVETLRGGHRLLPPSYRKGDEMVFLLPLDPHDYPVEVRDGLGRFRWVPHFCDYVRPDQNNIVDLEELQLYFPQRAVFQPLHLRVVREPGRNGMLSDIYEVGEAGIPLRQSYLISFRPAAGVSRDHLVVAQEGSRGWEYAGSTLGEAEDVYAAIRSFGRFCLMADSVPPTVRPVNFRPGQRLSGSRVILAVDDNFSGFEHTATRITLNGKWVPFGYDFKQKTLTWDLAGDRPVPGTYTLQIHLEDKARNVMEASYQLVF